jgi:hypothetical protein
MNKNFTKQDFYDLLKPNGECLEWTKGVATSGYGVTKVGRNKVVRTHRLALELEGIDIDGWCVLHSCDNILCCNPKHLRVGTHKENMEDMTKRKRQYSKLSEEQVLDIRSRYVEGVTTHLDLANEFGVSRQHVSDVINRRTWKHI